LAACSSARLAAATSVANVSFVFKYNTNASNKSLTLSSGSLLGLEFFSLLGSGFELINKQSDFYTPPLSQ
jgi:hypothetical protein